MAANLLAGTGLPPPHVTGDNCDCPRRLLSPTRRWAHRSALVMARTHHEHRRLPGDDLERDRQRCRIHFPGSTTCFSTLQPGGQCTSHALFLRRLRLSPYSEVLTFTTITSDGIGSPQSFTASGMGVATSGRLRCPPVTFSIRRSAHRRASDRHHHEHRRNPVTILERDRQRSHPFPRHNNLLHIASTGRTMRCHRGFFRRLQPAFTAVALTITSNGVGSPQSFTASGAWASQQRA